MNPIRLKSRSGNHFILFAAIATISPVTPVSASAALDPLFRIFRTYPQGQAISLSGISRIGSAAEPPFGPAPSAVAVLLNDSFGGFQSPSLAISADATTGALGDFNRDCKLDLAYPHVNAINIGIGTGLGTFTFQNSISTVGRPEALVVADNPCDRT